MKRKRSESPKMRVAGDVTEAVKLVTESTGWSEQVSLNFLARVGTNALSAKTGKLTGYRSLLAAATEHHQAEVAAKRKLSTTATKLREARRRLESKLGRPA